MVLAVLAGKWTVLGAFAIKAGAVMVLIALAAVATPYIARLIDKHIKPHGSKENKDGAYIEQDVHSIFEASHDEDFDPNYKIYNTDIYGFGKSKKTVKRSERNDKKNGEKQ